MTYLSIDTINSHTKKPNRVNDKFIPQGWRDYSLKEITDFIGKGHTFSCSQFADNKRNSIKWRGQQCFGVDVDNDTSLTPDQAIAYINKEFGCSPMLVYNTFSSTTTNNKYRLLIASDTLITDPIISQGIIRGLVKAIGADTLCVDLSRLFFGTTSEKIIMSQPTTIPIATLTTYATNHPYVEKLKTFPPIDREKLKSDLNDLTASQIGMLKAFVVNQSTEGLLDKHSSRYERLKRFGTKLADLGFIDWPLARQLTIEIIESRECLEFIYVHDYDKSYLQIVENLYFWRLSQ